MGGHIWSVLKAKLRLNMWLVMTEVTGQMLWKETAGIFRKSWSLVVHIKSCRAAVHTAIVVKTVTSGCLKLPRYSHFLLHFIIISFQVFFVFL